MRMIGVALLAAIFAQEKGKEPKTTKEAMQRLQILVGEWRVTGQPREMEREAWIESLGIGYRIDREKELYQLEMTVKDGVFWKDALLSWDGEKKHYRLEATLAAGGTRAYVGRHDAKKKELALVQDTTEWPRERVVFSLLRDNRVLYSVEKQEAEGRDWAELALMGCTKEGVPFVKGNVPVCVITGGGASIAVEYKGRTYYVC